MDVIESDMRRSSVSEEYSRDRVNWKWGIRVAPNPNSQIEEKRRRIESNRREGVGEEEDIIISNLIQFYFKR